MPVPNALLKKKAQGFVDSIGVMTAAERQIRPSWEFGHDYNKLVDMVAEANENLKELLPPKVTVVNQGPARGTHQRVAEILTYCQQIMQLL